MDIRHLRTFVTIARFKSITRAAEALHITQPAVSGQLKSLEEDLGLTLLSRTTSSVTLTQSGRDLLPLAESAVEAFGDFMHAAKSRRGLLTGQVRLGIPLLQPDALRVSSFMKVMVEAYPALQIDLHAGRITWLLDALRAAEIDASLFVCKTIPPDMDGVVLRHLRYMAVGPMAWEERLKNASWRDVEKLPWIRSPPGSAHDQIMKELCDRTGIKPRETIEADHESLILSLVTAGVGIGIVRDSIASAGTADRSLTTIGDLSIEAMLTLIYSPERASDPAISGMVKVLAAIWS